MLRYESLGDPTDLKVAISIYEKASALDLGYLPIKTNIFSGLGAAFHHRFEHANDFSDVEKPAGYLSYT